MISARHAVFEDCKRARAGSILRSVRQDSPSGDGVSQVIELVTRSAKRQIKSPPAGTRGVLFIWDSRWLLKCAIRSCWRTWVPTSRWLAVVCPTSSMAATMSGLAFRSAGTHSLDVNHIDVSILAHFLRRFNDDVVGASGHRSSQSTPLRQLSGMHLQEFRAIYETIK